MQEYQLDFTPAASLAAAMPSCVGRIVDITADGVPLVDFPDNTAGPVVARSTLTEPPVRGNHATDVLLVFENGDPERPIIAGLINPTLYPARAEAVAAPTEQPESAVVDGEHVRITGREEIVLECGRSSITLRKDGKIVIRGIEISSRAAGTHRIKGGSVRIN